MTGQESSLFAERLDERLALAAGLARQGTRDERVLAAIRRVPRHAFVPPARAAEAYQDKVLPIGAGQTISQPFVVATMTEAARPEPGDRCLEIGTGSGYQTAVLAEVLGKVHSIEFLPEIAGVGEGNLRRAGYGDDRVQLRTGDGYEGWPEHAPFNVILVAAAPERVPPPLLAQLALGGRLVIPVGSQAENQVLERWTRVAEGSGQDAFLRERLLDVRFVPFLGAGSVSPTR